MKVTTTKIGILKSFFEGENSEIIQRRHLKIKQNLPKQDSNEFSSHQKTKQLQGDIIRKKMKESRGE